MSEQNDEKKVAANGSGESKWVGKFLSIVERGGNLLPHPATLFGIFAGLVVVFSGLFAMMDLEVLHPGTGEMVKPVSLMTLEGLHRMMREMVPNFTGFAPLGVVLVALMGIGVAEGSGLIGAALRLLVIKAPERLLTFVIVFAGVLSNMASEVGYVLLVPLGAVIFLAVGRHPLAGLAAAFAGVSGGYSANLLLGTVDPLLAGLSTEAAQIIDETYTVNPACNYYFMFVSTFFIAAAGTWVTEKLVIPRLGTYTGEEVVDRVEELNDDERRGLRFSVWTLLGLTILAVWSVVPESWLPGGGFLLSSGYDTYMESFLKSTFLEGIVPVIFVGGAILGVAYGIGARTIKNDTDVMNGMGKAMSTLGIYMVLCFFAAQFVSYFKWTNLGLIFAVEGAAFLEATDLGPIPLIIAFIFLSALANMFMGSASAKWAILAPVFIPMFMLTDPALSPELVQAAYRVGDSTTNIISPMMSYFALIVAFMQRYKEDAGIGTIVATMLPYTIVFLIVWCILLGFWVIFDFPVGPGAGLFLN